MCDDFFLISLLGFPWFVLFTESLHIEKEKKEEVVNIREKNQRP